MTCVIHGELDCATCGIARVRAAMAVAPRPAKPTDPNETRAAAIERARAERLAATRAKADKEAR